MQHMVLLLTWDSYRTIGMVTGSKFRSPDAGADVAYREVEIGMTQIIKETVNRGHVD